MGNFFENALDEAKRIPPWLWVVLAIIVWVFARNLLGGATGGLTSGVSGLLSSVTGGGSSSAGSSGTVASSPSGDTGTPSAATGTVNTGASSGMPTSSSAATAGAPSSGSGTPTPAVAASTVTPTSQVGTTVGSVASAGNTGRTKSYTVKSGDTLVDIAASHGTSWQSLYQSNQSTIESTAKAHGFADSNHGWWIFPGEVLSV